jgi:hypothetical protein
MNRKLTDAGKMPVFSQHPVHAAVKKGPEIRPFLSSHLGLNQTVRQVF